MNCPSLTLSLLRYHFLNEWKISEKKAKQNFAEIGPICVIAFCWDSVLPSIRGKHFIFLYIYITEYTLLLHSF